MFGVDRSVSDLPDIAGVAALLGDTSRATMVTALGDGRTMPASQLARIARVSRSTASEHLHRLVDSGLLRAERCGRHTYYAINGPNVAAAVESLAVLAPRPQPDSLSSVRRQDGLARARLCYDHLAGEIGVLIADSLRDRGLIEDADGRLRVREEAWDRLAPLGVTCQHTGTTRRPLVRGCVDWTARRHHLAGILGAQLTRRMFDLAWVVRPHPSERVIRLTEDGAEGLASALGLDRALLT